MKKQEGVRPKAEVRNPQSSRKRKEGEAIVFDTPEEAVIAFFQRRQTDSNPSRIVEVLATKVIG